MRNFLWLLSSTAACSRVSSVTCLLFQTLSKCDVVLSRTRNVAKNEDRWQAYAYHLEPSVLDLMDLILVEQLAGDCLYRSRIGMLTVLVRYW